MNQMGCVAAGRSIAQSAVSCVAAGRSIAQSAVSCVAAGRSIAQSAVSCSCIAEFHICVKLWPFRIS